MNTNLPSPTRLIVLMSSHYRPEVTRECLRRLHFAADYAEVSIEVFHAVSCHMAEHFRLLKTDFPTVHFFPVPADCYWACAMTRAMTRAKGKEFEFLLWLNDDVFLVQDALSTMIHTWTHWERPSLVSASLKDPTTGTMSYGVARRASRIFGLRFEVLQPHGSTTVGQVSNGNALLIPRDAYEILGGFPKGFSHNLADIHYTLAASRAGFDIISPGFFLGECQENPASAQWKTLKVLGFRERWRLLLKPTGLQPRHWIPFAFRNGGLLGFLYAVQPYLKAAFLSCRDQFRRWWVRAESG